MQKSAILEEENMSSTGRFAQLVYKVFKKVFVVMHLFLTAACLGWAIYWVRLQSPKSRTWDEFGQKWGLLGLICLDFATAITLFVAKLLWNFVAQIVKSIRDLLNLENSNPDDNYPNGRRLVYVVVITSLFICGSLLSIMFFIHGSHVLDLRTNLLIAFGCFSWHVCGIFVVVEHNKERDCVNHLATQTGE